MRTRRSDRTSDPGDTCATLASWPMVLGTLQTSFRSARSQAGPGLRVDPLEPIRPPIPSERLGRERVELCLDGIQHFWRGLAVDGLGENFLEAL